MNANDNKYKIVYCTPALYMAGGVERVLTLKANYFAEQYGHDITIILTERVDKPLFYPLSEKVHVVNLDINFEELWGQPFVRKVFLYMKKQREFRRKLKAELMRIRPDITVSLLRREINFITSIPDGSRKVGEMHINRANYRNFRDNDSNIFKRLFSHLWMSSLVKKLRRLDLFVVLTDEDRLSWTELNNVITIPNPMSFTPTRISQQGHKRIIAVGRYVYEKGFDMLLEAWSRIEKQCPEWEMAFYGMGERAPYEDLATKLGIDKTRCHLNGSTEDIEKEYSESSLFVLSSRFEGFGMVIVEAMSCGLPVVSFACPCGPRYIINDGQDGLLVENGNVEQLSQSILSLIKDDDRRKQMGKTARINAQRFDINIIAERWQQQFKMIMDSKQPH